MAKPAITVRGLREARKFLEELKKGADEFGGRVVMVGTTVPYGYGIEFGRHRKSGRIARKAGGAYYLTNALNEVMSQAEADMIEGLEIVGKPGLWVLRRLGRWVRRLARQKAPRGPSGRLRRHMRVVVRRVNQ